MNEAAFELIKTGDFGLAQRLLDYGLNHTGKGQADRTRRMMVVNYANALKLGGDKARAQAELRNYDWSAASKMFQISVAAVLDDIDEVVALMSAVVTGGDLDEASFREWPVFKPMADQKKFQDKFKEVFKRELAETLPLHQRPSEEASEQPEQAQTRH